MTALPGASFVAARAGSPSSGGQAFRSSKGACPRLRRLVRCRMMKYGALIVAALCAIAAVPPPAPLALTGAEARWTDRFGTARTDWANRFVELSDGSLVAAGFVNRDDQGSDPDWDST